MQTIRDIRHNQDGVVIPSGFKANGWSSVLSHEMNVLFQSLCFVVTEHETKAEMEKALDEIEALKGTFSEPVKEAFKSEADYEGYVNLLNRFKSFLKRSDYDYPTSRAEAIELFVKWGLVIDHEDYWDIPIHPFPDASQLFKLSEVESLALAHVKLEALVHPVFSRLVLMLHERDENTFSISKAEMKEMLNTNDQMLAEVLIKLTPYMEEAIENMLELPDDEKLNFTIVWERIYEDFLGQPFSSNVQ
ncbi:DUF6042 family protein [Brevibacillus sp. SAFN-007a]|uniref:DUF6042 family protein n=1 Tax=Brevibacillus sp. SAFN-007a TaxID=3436862 RepID=UPI003F8174E5